MFYVKISTKDLYQKAHRPQVQKERGLRIKRTATNSRISLVLGVDSIERNLSTMDSLVMFNSTGKKATPSGKLLFNGTVA